MHKIVLLLLLAITAATHANVVRPAPDFTWPGAENRTKSLKSLRGQPVVIVIADSPRAGDFRKQVKWLRQSYAQLAARGTIFIAAFRSGEGPVKSDIPFVVANNGPAVASAYGVDRDFALVVIGKDGNIDYLTKEVRTGERVRDVINNSFPMQAAARR